MLDEVKLLEAMIDKHTDKEERADPGFKEELEAELVALNEEIGLVVEEAHKE